MTITEFASFLGWCTLLNFALLFIAASVLQVARKPVFAIHGRMTGIEETELKQLYFNFLGNYKLLIIAFNLVPYIALRIMGH